MSQKWICALGSECKNLFAYSQRKRDNDSAYQRPEHALRTGGADKIGSHQGPQHARRAAMAQECLDGSARAARCDAETPGFHYERTRQMAPPNPKALIVAVNKQNKKKVHFALEGDGFVPVGCTLKVRRTGGTGSWKCSVLKNDSSTTLLVGWFQYEPRPAADERSDGRGTDELEFVVTNPDGSEKKLIVTIPVVDDPPDVPGV